MCLAAELKAEAHRLGFQLVGITTPDPPQHLDVFAAWLQAGRHGEMGYLAEPRSFGRRADPRQILPECQAILVLGVRYPAPPEQREQSGRFHGQVAAYAWGKDYHEVLPSRLQALVAFLEERVGAPIHHRWYTDSGPLLERDLAQRAGLGWIGKNTCLIHPRLGSYFLLAEILLGIELEPDPPFLADRCGACTRCIDVCPTQCILPDRTLDARRCISYLTIELKSAIPPELRSELGAWVFGCDLCQQVCPWNRRFADPAGDPAFAPRLGMPSLDLIVELRLSPDEFSQRFRGSPVKRARRRGYLRNVAVALGNLAHASSDPAAIRVLSAALLENSESVVRQQAAWSLGQVGGEVARQALQRAWESERDALVRQEIRAALEACCG
jgi:epoxyqueuosine reductase